MQVDTQKIERKNETITLMVRLWFGSKMKMLHGKYIRIQAPKYSQKDIQVM